MSRVAKFIWGWLAVFAVAAIAVTYLGDSSGENTSESAEQTTAMESSNENVQSGRTSSRPYGGEVEDGRSFGEVLATEMTGSVPAPRRVSRRFNQLIDQIAQGCNRSREWVSDRIVGGHQALVDRGGSASLMDVAAGWSEAVQGGTSMDCNSVLAGLLTMLEQQS